jgi:hypothetical protein
MGLKILGKEVLPYGNGVPHRFAFHVGIGHIVLEDRVLFL